MCVADDERPVQIQVSCRDAKREVSVPEDVGASWSIVDATQVSLGVPTNKKSAGR